MVSVPPSEVGLDPDRVARLIDLAGKKVRAARLPSAQLAIARHGRLAAVCTLTPDAEPTQEAQPLYVGFSTTKALISAAVWLLMQDGQLTPERLVSELIQEPTLPSMEGVTVQHLMTHTAGFPDARLDPPMDWEDREARLAHFARWESQWPPGSRFCYHPTATMWVLAEVIERTSGQDFRDLVRARITEPLGLRDLHIGLPEGLNERVADVVHVGRAVPRLFLRMLGLRLPAHAVDEPYFETYNRPEVRAVGVPSSGAVTSAPALALFYQALLRGLEGGDSPWRQDTLRAALEVRTGALVDPMTGRLANRCLGLVVAGERARKYRGFAATCSPRAFGHPGAGGQVAWADPETGISFAFLTSGFDRNLLRLGLRGVALSNHAASCAAAS